MCCLFVFTVTDEAVTLTLLEQADTTCLHSNLDFTELSRTQAPMELHSAKVAEIFLPLPLPPNWHTKILHYTHSGGYHNSRPLSNEYLKKIKTGMGAYPCLLQPISLHWPSTDDHTALVALKKFTDSEDYTPTEAYNKLLQLVLHPTLSTSLENSHELKIIPMEGQHTLKILQDYSHEFYHYCSIHKNSSQKIFTCSEQNFPYDKISDILNTLIQDAELFAALPTHIKEICNLFQKNTYVNFTLYNDLTEETRTKIINLSNQTFTHFANSFLTFCTTARQFLLTLIPEYNASCTYVTKEKVMYHNTKPLSSAMQESIATIPPEALHLVHPSLKTVSDGWYFYSLLIYRTTNKKPQGYYALAPHQHIISRLSAWLHSQLPSYKSSQTLTREKFSNLSEFIHILLSSQEVFELIQQLWDSDKTVTVGTFKFSRALSLSAHRTVLCEALLSKTPKTKYITACKLYTTLNTFCTELWLRYSNSQTDTDPSRILVSTHEFCEKFGFPPITHTSKHTDKTTGKKELITDLTPSQHLTQLLKPTACEFYDAKMKSRSNISHLDYPYVSTTQKILSLCTKVRLNLQQAGDTLVSTLSTRPDTTCIPVENLITPSDLAHYQKIQHSARTVKDSLKGSELQLTTPPFSPTPSRSIHATMLQPLTSYTIDNYLAPLLGDLHNLSMSFTLVFDLDQLSSNFNLHKFPETLLYQILTKAFSYTYHDSPAQTVLIAGDSYQLSQLQKVISNTDGSSTYSSQLLYFGRHSKKYLATTPPTGKLATPATVCVLLLTRSNDQKFLSSFHSTLPLIDFVSCKLDIPVFPKGDPPITLPTLTSHSFQPWMLAYLYKYKTTLPPNLTIISFNKPRISWGAAHFFCSSISFLDESSHAQAIRIALSKLTHTGDPPKTWTSRLLQLKKGQVEATLLEGEAEDDQPSTLTQVPTATVAVAMEE